MRCAMLTALAVLLVGGLALAEDGSVAWPVELEDDGSVLYPTDFDLFAYFEPTPDALPQSVDWVCYHACMFRWAAKCWRICRWTGPLFKKCSAACMAYAAGSCLTECSR